MHFHSRRPGHILKSHQQTDRKQQCCAGVIDSTQWNTQRLGFGRASVYSGVHWQWHIMPGRPSPLPIWYQSVFSQHCLCYVTPSFQRVGHQQSKYTRFRVWRACMEDKQRIKVISAGEDVWRALGVIQIEDKLNELWPLQRSEQFLAPVLWSSWPCCVNGWQKRCKKGLRKFSFISKSLIWAHANCPNVLLKTRMLQEPRWPFLKS